MNLDFKLICRICLKPSKGSIDLFPKNGVRDLSKEETEKIIEKFDKCYNIRVSPDDGLPTKVCHKCIQIVSIFYVSMQNAIVSQQFLKNSLALKQLAEKDGAENQGDQSNKVVENASTNDISPPNLEVEHVEPVDVNNEGSREDLVNSDAKPPDDVIQDSVVVKNNSIEKPLETITEDVSVVKDDCTENQTLKPSSKPVLNENNNELDVQLNKSSEKKLLQEGKENNISHLKPSKVHSTTVSVAVEKKSEKPKPKKDESIYDFDDDDDDDPDDDKPLTQIISETDKSTESNKSYLKLKRSDSNVSINKNCTNNQISHKVHSNTKIKNSNRTDKSMPSVTKSEKKLKKVKKSSKDKKKKLLKSPEKEKKDKLKEYYEKLLTIDNSLKVEYCRVTSQKSKLNKESAAEKKLTHELNHKIYSLVRVTVNIVNAISGMKTCNEKEKMEKVFDRLISCDGKFENFAKQKQDLNNIREDDLSRSENSSKKKENGEKSGKSEAQKFADSLHENMKSKWNCLQLKVPDKSKLLDSSTGKVPAKDTPKTQLETPKETQKTKVEISKETQKTLVETPKDTQKFQVKTPKDIQKPLVETTKESQETPKSAEKRSSKETKVIGTDLDLDNILPYDAKRRRTTVLDDSKTSVTTPSKSDKKDSEDEQLSSSETSPESKPPPLKMKKLQGLKVGSKYGANDKKLKLMKSKQKNKSN